MKPDDCFSTEELASYTYQFFLRNLPPEISCRYMEFSFEFSDLVPNVTVAPQSGDRNWLKNETKPLGYPGWIGYIEYETSDALPKRFPSYMKNSLIHPIVVQDAKYWSPDDLRQKWQTCFFLDDWKHLELAVALTNNKLEGFYGYFNEHGEYYT